MKNCSLAFFLLDVFLLSLAAFLGPLLIALPFVRSREDGENVYGAGMLTTWFVWFLLLGYGLESWLAVFSGLVCLAVPVAMAITGSAHDRKLVLLGVVSNLFLCVAVVCYFWWRFASHN